MKTKISRLLTALLALILMTCLSGVQGQYTMPSSGYSVATPSVTQNTDQYSQYYTLNKGPTPSAHIGAPQQFEIAGNMPTTVYFSNQMQAVPFSRYQSSPVYSGNNSLWIKGAMDWSQYATVPLGANVSLLTISPIEGSGTLNLVDSDGKTYSYNYFFYNNSQLTFYADSPGRHTLYFVVGGISSNPVVIDVTGTVTMTYNPISNYYPPASNYYPPTSNYPGYYEPYSYNGPQAALDLADANKAYQKLYGNYYQGDWNYGIYPWLNSP
jgi:hypothetical protein